MCYKIYIINIFLGVFMLNITEKSEGEAAKDYVLRQLIYNIVHTNLLPGGRKGDVSEETRNVIEKLTGISYDKCFGNNNIGYKE